MVDTTDGPHAFHTRLYTISTVSCVVWKPVLDFVMELDVLVALVEVLVRVEVLVALVLVTEA